MSSYSDYAVELADLQATFNFVERSTTDESSRQQAQAENAARPATAQCVYVSTGTGQRRISKPIRFPVVFRSQPFFTTGSHVLFNPAPTVWHDPIGHAGIVSWVRDDDGNYTGARIWVRVEVHPIDSANTDMPPNTLRTRHYLSFHALAIKDLPTNTLDPTLTPRPTELLYARTYEAYQAAQAAADAAGADDD